MVIHARNFVTSDDALGGSVIEKSLRFRRENSARFYKDITVNGNRYVYTLACWVKRHQGGEHSFFDFYNSDSARLIFQFYFDHLRIFSRIGGSTVYNINYDHDLRDYHSWMHVVFEVDVTRNTQSERIKVYVNGVQQTAASGADLPSQTANSRANRSGSEHRIGCQHDSGGDEAFIDANFADFWWIDGRALDPTNFGYTESQTGLWRPKRFDERRDIFGNIGPNNGTTWSSNVTTSNFNSGTAANMFDGSYNSTATVNSTDASNNYVTTSSVNVVASKIGVVLSNSSTDIQVYVNGSVVGTVAGADIINDTPKHFEFTFTEATVSTIKVQRPSSTSGWQIYGISLNGVPLIDGATTNIGVNGYHLEFKDTSSTSGYLKDTSGNGNHFASSTGFSAANDSTNDSSLDTPSNNYSTFTTLLTDHRSDTTYNHGNLKITTGSGASTVGNSIAVGSGKWYAEFKCTAKSSVNMMVGVQSNYGFDGEKQINETQNGGRGYAYINNGNKALTDGSNPSYGATWDIGDVMGIALDMDRFKVNFSKNGAWQGEFDIQDVYGGQPLSYHMCCGHGQSGVTATFEANFGQRAFSYTPPSYHKAINQANLSLSKSESHTVIVRPQKHFDTLLYTATGNAMSVTGLEFKPDLIWQKRRDATSGSHFHYWFDSVRGGRYILQSNTNAGDGDAGSNTNIVFKHGGFDMAASDGGQGNATGGTYVAWCWKAGGAAVSNANGNITSSVSVNEEAGFSIVSYTGNGSNGQTVGHGLSRAPQWIILKNRDATQNWRVWQEKLSPTGAKRLLLDATNQNEDASFLNDTAPTSTVFTLGNADDAWNANGDKFIAYCWHEVPGFSKFGRYTGNGNDNGPFIYLGFRPAWVMFKLTSGADDWPIYDIKRDSVNVADHRLFANTSSAEGAVGQEHFDFLSNGIKFRKQKNPFNNSGAEYVYFAFAEQSGFTPFDTSTNAK
tara:strand:- start:49 stop:2919 length:2871 start_codon:yes stop_codon:yes gene_type:complete